MDAARRGSLTVRFFSFLNLRHAHLSYVLLDLKQRLRLCNNWLLKLELVLCVSSSPYLYLTQLNVCNLCINYLHSSPKKGRDRFLSDNYHGPRCSSSKISAWSAFVSGRDQVVVCVSRFACEQHSARGVTGNYVKLIDCAYQAADDHCGNTNTKLVVSGAVVWSANAFSSVLRITLLRYGGFP